MELKDFKQRNIAPGYIFLMVKKNQKMDGKRLKKL